MHIRAEVHSVIKYIIIWIMSSPFLSYSIQRVEPVYIQRIGTTAVLVRIGLPISCVCSAIQLLLRAPNRLNYQHPRISLGLQIQANVSAVQGLNAVAYLSEINISLSSCRRPRHTIETLVNIHNREGWIQDAKVETVKTLYKLQPKVVTPAKVLPISILMRHSPINLSWLLL
jgi:hypothetical protein